MKKQKPIKIKGQPSETEIRKALGISKEEWLKIRKIIVKLPKDTK